MKALPLTPAEQDWLDRYNTKLAKPKVPSIPGLVAAESREQCCKTCQHFYRHNYSQKRYTYCRRFKSTYKTAYGHCKTKPTMVCGEWIAEPTTGGAA